MSNNCDQILQWAPLLPFLEGYAKILKERRDAARGEHAAANTSAGSDFDEEATIAELEELIAQIKTCLGDAENPGSEIDWDRLLKLGERVATIVSLALKILFP